MAKHCGNCGSEMEQNDKVCGKCGTPFADGNDEIQKEKLKSFNESSKSKVPIKYGIIVILIIVLMVGAVNIISNFTGTKGLVSKVMSAYEDYDIDALVSMSSDIYFYANEDFVENYFKNSVEDDLDYYESSIGHNYEFSYEIDEIYSASERKKSELIDGINYLYSDFDTDTITDISIADVTVIVEKGDESIQNKIHITMTKEEKGWKILYIE